MNRRPNLLLIQTDQQKATSLDLYNRQGPSIRTDALRRLADDGVVCEAGYCPYPLCIPSRVSMLTALHPSSAGFIGNKPYPMHDRHPNLFAHLRRQGYRSLLVGKDHAIGLPDDGAEAERWSLRGAMAESFDRAYSTYHNASITPEVARDLPHIPPFLKGTKELYRLWGSAVAPWDGDQSVSGRLCDVAVDWLEAWQRDDAPRGKPFAMWLSFPDPHEFYQCARDAWGEVGELPLPPNYRADLGDRAEYVQFMRWYFNAGGVPDEVALQLVRVYHAMCLTVDRQLRKVLDWLDRSGQREDTIVVYTSDHGDFNGELGLLQKFNAGYDGCCRVPLIVSWPGHVRRGVRLADPVNLVDLPGTLLKLMGLPGLPRDEGRHFDDALLSERFTPRGYTVVESGVPGPGLGLADIARFPGHRWDVEPKGRWCYDPPHRFGGRMWAVRTQDAKLIVRQGQASEFYDLATDPWEMRNRIADPTCAAQVLAHHEHLVQHLARIAPVPEGTHVADQDRIYTPGPGPVWERCLAIAAPVKG